MDNGDADRKKRTVNGRRGNKKCVARIIDVSGVIHPREYQASDR